ncbi:PhoPQ-activated protein PqaA family protein [Pseudomonas sp. NPDC090755]|uniref:PhoPQ-activated protein PqaA family protein n=1 Tax=Pseudomonas sp. NPDC090755 TaxID=3364481 RepID=UPI00383A3D5F
MLRQLVLMVALSMPMAVLASTADIDCKQPHQPFQHVVYCHIDALRAQPLDFQLVGQHASPTMEVRRYLLNSQRWTPYPVSSPQVWQHQVDLYLSVQARPGQALLVINNGLHQQQQEPDYPAQTLQQIASATRTLVVSLSDVPNQPLFFDDDQQWRIEDVAVAHTWKHFLGDPQRHRLLALHVPMAGAAARAMDLVQAKLPQYRHFILVGASKRGWAAWLAALADDRVSALAPAVIEIADGKNMLEQLRRNYGGQWPIALAPYQAAGVLAQLQAPSFDRLMEIMDPLQYRDSALADRLLIPKYLISASGDDFFAPDHTARYVPKLPGNNAVRVAPNSDHYGIRAYAGSSLIPMVNRLQQGHGLPTLRSSVTEDAGIARLKVSFSEPPRALRLWRAANERDRDFRYACGIRYQATTLVPPPGLETLVELGRVESGWQAAFLQATFDDGFIATSPVHVMPDDKFPDQPPWTDGASCSTLAD